MSAVMLKKTKARLDPIIEVPTWKVVKYKYLYTDTGKASEWSIAVRLPIEAEKEAPDEITIRVEVGGQNDAR